MGMQGLLLREGVQGKNYYVNPEIEKFRYNPYRLKNRRKAEWSCNNNIALPFPLHAIIEVSSLCNLSCGFCNREKME